MDTLVLTPRNTAALRAAQIKLRTVADRLAEERPDAAPAVALASAADGIDTLLAGRGDLITVRLDLLDALAAVAADLAPGVALWSIASRRAAAEALEVINGALARLAA